MRNVKQAFAGLPLGKLLLSKPLPAYCKEKCDASICLNNFIVRLVCDAF